MPDQISVYYLYNGAGYIYSMSIYVCMYEGVCVLVNIAYFVENFRIVNYVYVTKSNYLWKFENQELKSFTRCVHFSSNNRGEKSSSNKSTMYFSWKSSHVAQYLSCLARKLILGGNSQRYMILNQVFPLLRANTPTRRSDNRVGQIPLHLEPTCESKHILKVTPGIREWS